MSEPSGGLREALEKLLDAIPSRAYGYGDDEERDIEIQFERVVHRAKSALTAARERREGMSHSVRST